MKNNVTAQITIAVILVAISFLLSFGLSDRLFQLRGIVDYKEDNNVLRIHMLGDPDNENDRQMRIVSLNINEENLNLVDYDNEDWEWKEEWRYTLYSVGDEDFVVEYNHPIKSVAMEYSKQQNSGKAQIYIGDDKVKQLNMYSSNWYMGNMRIKCLGHNEKIYECIKMGVFIALLLILIEMSVFTALDKEKKHGVSSKLGMFDAAKGMSMLIIILGHMQSDLIINFSQYQAGILISVFGVLLCNGLMPMFFIMSGYGFRGEKVGKCIKKQLTFLLKPYCILMTISIGLSALKALMLDSYTMIDVRNLLLSYLCFNTIETDTGFHGINLVTVGPIWFCIALCVAWIVLNFIFKLKNEKLIFIAVVAVTFCGMLMQRLPYDIYARTQFIAVIPYIYTGYLLRTKKVFQKENRFSFIKYIVVALLGCTISLVNGICLASSNDMGNNYILGVISCVATGIILLRLYFVINSKFKFMIFKRIGRVTLDIIYVHSLEYVVIPWKKIAAAMDMPTILKFVILSVVRCILVYIMYVIWQRIKQMFKNIIKEGK